MYTNEGKLALVHKIAWLDFVSCTFRAQAEKIVSTFNWKDRMVSFLVREKVLNYRRLV